MAQALTVAAAADAAAAAAAAATAAAAAATATAADTTREVEDQLNLEPAVDVTAVQPHSPPPREGVLTLDLTIDFSDVSETDLQQSNKDEQRRRLTLRHHISPDSEPLFEAVELVRKHNLESGVVEPLAKHISEHVEALREQPEQPFFFEQQDEQQEALHTYRREAAAVSPPRSTASFRMAEPGAAPWSPPGPVSGANFFSQITKSHTLPTPIVSVSIKSPNDPQTIDSSGKIRPGRTENHRTWSGKKDARYQIPISTLHSIRRRWRATAQTAGGQQCRKYYRTHKIEGVDFEAFLLLVRSVLRLTPEVFSDRQVECLHGYLLAGRDRLPAGDMFAFLRGSI